MTLSSILDEIQPTLPPLLWDSPESPEPKLKPAHKRWIVSSIHRVLTDAGYTDIDTWLRLYLTGSLTTYQYGANSDVDISLFVSSQHLPDWSRAEMIAAMVEHLDGELLPGTPYPMQDFVVGKGIAPGDLYKPGLRSGYDILEDRWIAPPDPASAHDVATQENGFYTYALSQADKMEHLLRYEKDKAVLMWHQLHKKRRDDQIAGKGDHSESNIVLKFLAKRGLLPAIAEASGEHIAGTATNYKVHEGAQTSNPNDPNRPLLWLPEHKHVLRGAPGATQGDLVQEYDPLLRHLVDRSNKAKATRYENEGPRPYYWFDDHPHYIQGTMLPNGQAHWYSTSLHPDQDVYDREKSNEWHPDAPAVNAALGAEEYDRRGDPRACPRCGGDGWGPDPYHDNARGCGIYNAEERQAGGCGGSGMSESDPLKEWQHRSPWLDEWKAQHPTALERGRAINPELASYHPLCPVCNQPPSLLQPMAHGWSTAYQCPQMHKYELNDGHSADLGPVIDRDTGERVSRTFKMAGLDHQSVLDSNAGVDLEGLPGPINVPGTGPLHFHSSAPIQQMAEDYGRRYGIPQQRPTDYRGVDPAISARIAQEYERMPHAPNDPAVRESYDALMKETRDQYDHAVQNGYQFEFYPPDRDPYPNSPREAVLDLHHNRHMYVYPTSAGYGSDDQNLDHPLLADSGVRWNGQPVTHNDLFRGIHDLYGHAKEGVGFRAVGEDNAFRQHAGMFSPTALPAMTAETRGQNSYVNFGPNGEYNQTAGQGDTVYAPQKAGVMPAWTSDPDLHPQSLPQVQSSIREADKPKDPPHYRLATKSPEACLTCEMFDHRDKTCWGYGNKKVKADHVCDSWKRGSKVDQPGFFSRVASSSVAETAAAAAPLAGGITIGLDGVPKTEGFAFCPTKQTELRVPLADLTPEVIDQFIRQNLSTLSMPDNYLGLWVDDGTTYIDVSQVLPDERQALAIAAANHQLAIFDLSNFREIRVPEAAATGAPAFA